MRPDRGLRIAVSMSAVNAVGAEVVAKAAAMAGAGIVHFALVAATQLKTNENRRRIEAAPAWVGQQC